MKNLSTNVSRMSVAYWNSFSIVGLLMAAIFFAGSVTPSLLPRVWVVQGCLSGFALAVGYALGVSLVWLWRVLELPQLNERWNLRLKQASVIAVSIIVAVCVWKSTEWQNSIRRLMEMPDVSSTSPYMFLTVAIVVAVLLIGITRGLILGVRLLSQRLERYLPRRLAIGISSIAVVFLALIVSNDLIVKQLLRAADRVFLRADQFIEPDVEPPTATLACGSPDSLVTWESVGRLGRDFLSSGPSNEDIAATSGRPAKRPIRVYVGMPPDDDDVHRQAERALDELIRVGAFERQVLVVATPTGTGWLDQGAVDTVEYLHDGDTAIVSMQYSYLPSWITILVDPSRSIRSGKALFDAVYDHWTKLAADERPDLFLFGLSLGSLGCEEAADLIDTFEDPIQGAVWSGPPFPSPQWKQIVRSRSAGSPIWMPHYRDGSMVRFTAQKNHLDTGERWGPIRNVYIQYASDPMVWFSPDLAWRRPEWLTEPRGPDVSPALRWYPLLTFLQVGFDLPLATSLPIGFGHNYSASSYIDGWREVTQPKGWSDEDVMRLKEQMRERETNR